MLLAIDLGNTNLTLGLFSEGELLHTFRIESRRERTADEYAIALAQMLELRRVSSSEVTAAIIASVVPTLTRVLLDAVRLAFHLEALVVGPGTDVGLTLRVDRPEEVGADRIVNVAAARARALIDAGTSDPNALLDRGAIVIDLGTATTFDCLSPRGEFVGGVIVPGVRTSLDALIARAAKLPTVELIAPQAVLGKNTVQCLQSGMVYGYASLVDGLVSKLKAELTFDCEVIATGGLAASLEKHTQSIERVDPNLTLWGLLAIYRRN